MSSYIAFARDNLRTEAVILAVIMAGTYVIVRALKQREKRRRTAARQATRAEQDRIWNERTRQQ